MTEKALQPQISLLSLRFSALFSAPAHGKPFLHPFWPRPLVNSLGSPWISLHPPLCSWESTNPQQATPGSMCNCEVGLAVHGHIPMWPVGVGHWESIPWILRQRGQASPTPLGSTLGSTEEICEPPSWGNPWHSLLLWISPTQLSTGHINALNLHSTPMCTMSVVPQAPGREGILRNK